MHQIFRWNGEYFGFIANGRFFDRNSKYVGWLGNDGKVWKSDGHFLGELVDGSYILRRTSMVMPIPRVPLVPPVSPVPPVPSMNRVGRVGRAGWVDALDEC